MMKCENACAAARSNIVGLAKSFSMNLRELASIAGISADNLLRFVDGDDTLTQTDMLRVCEALDIPIWAIHLRELDVDAADDVFNTINQLIGLVPQMRSEPIQT